MLQTTQIIDILGEHNIFPDEPIRQTNLRGIGKISDDELIYPINRDDIFKDDLDNDILDEVWNAELDDIIEINKGKQLLRGGLLGEIMSTRPKEQSLCAWYAPIHYFGHDWGIYIKEDCIFRQALEIAQFVDWRSVTLTKRQIKRQLLLSSFYIFYLHEQFHHKVESLGFRFLISTSTDRYLNYKSSVYRKFYMTKDCLEEALANAESFRRLNEKHYKERIATEIRTGLRNFLKWNIANQPPGYSEGINFLTDRSFQQGLWKLQSQMKDGTLSTITPPNHWRVAPDMIKAMSNIADRIYFVIPNGRSPRFPATIDPSATTSSSKLIKALIKFYGYAKVSGGKGSHVKLEKPSAPTLIVPGSSSSLTPGVLKHVMTALGGYPISRLPDLLEGKL